MLRRSYLSSLYRCPLGHLTNHPSGVFQGFLWLYFCSLKNHFHSISRLIFIAQDPDNKTVFGCFIQPDYAEYMYELYAFESEEVSGNKEALC